MTWRYALSIAFLLAAGGCSTVWPDTASGAAAPSSATPHSAEETRADFLKLIHRPHAALTPEVHADPVAATLPADAGYSQFRFSYATDAHMRVPGILLKPSHANGRLPVIIALHGTGGKKEGELPFMRQLVAKGFLAVAIDAPYHGERAASPQPSAGPQPADGLKNAYERAIYSAWKHDNGVDASRSYLPHPFFFDTVWDMMRLVDYLQTRDDVDPARIGMYGVSKGGIETYLTAAVDPRIAVAVPCISVESFRYALDHDVWQHRIETIQTAFNAAAKDSGIVPPAKPDAAFVAAFYDRVCPGIADRFDGPAMVPLIAPRPLLTINGELDPRTPPASLKLCTDPTQSAYHAQHADDRLRILIEPNTAHKVTPAAEQTAIDFFVKWLKPAAAP